LEPQVNIRAKIFVDVMKISVDSTTIGVDSIRTVLALPGLQAQF
jgi:hypothetical protein